MDLNINSPAYYTREYGVDDDIYWMCRELSYYVREKKYSDAINIIGIVPIVAPAAVLEKGLCKAHKRCELKSGFASVSLLRFKPIYSSVVAKEGHSQRLYRCCAIPLKIFTLPVLPTVHIISPAVPGRQSAL